MRKSALWAGLLALPLFACLFAAPAYAQATRTWVSGVGDDANPCSRTAPCKTFAGAISKTATAGEINVLDPGGFGAITITKSITISSEGFEAGVLVSGTNGIVVNGPGSTVILRGLDIEGIGTGLTGVNFLAGSNLFIEKSVIHGFSGISGAFGINFTPNSPANLFVEDTLIRGNGSTGAGGGIHVAPSSGGSASVTLTRVAVEQNRLGVQSDGTNGPVKTSIRTSTIASNTLAAAQSIGNATTIVDSSSISNNGGNALVANGAAAIVNVGRSIITGNLAVFNAVSGGVVQSYGDNDIDGNTTNTAPPNASHH